MYFNDQEKKGVWGIAPRVLTLFLILFLTLFSHPPQGVWGTKSHKVLTLVIDQNHKEESWGKSLEPPFIS